MIKAHSKRLLHGITNWIMTNKCGGKNDAAFFFFSSVMKIKSDWYFMLLLDSQGMISFIAKRIKKRYLTFFLYDIWNEVEKKQDFWVTGVSVLMSRSRCLRSETLRFVAFLFLHFFSPLVKEFFSLH